MFTVYVCASVFWRAQMPTLDFAQMPTPDVSFDRYRDSDLSDVMYPFYVFGIMFAELLILMHWTTIWNTLFMILDFWTNDDVFSYRIKIWVIVFVLYAGLYIFCEPFRIILDFYMWIICCVMKAAYKSIRSAVLGFIWVVEERQRIFASIKRMMHTIRSKFPSRIVPNDPKNDAEPAAPCNSNHTSAKYVSQPDTAPPQLILDRGEDELLDLITDQLNFRKKDVKTEFNRLVSEIEASLAKRGELTDKEKFKIYQNEMPRETSRFDSTDYSKLVCVVEKHLLKKKLLNSRIRILMLLKWTSDNTSDLVIAYLVNLFEGDDGLHSAEITLISIARLVRIKGFETMDYESCVKKCSTINIQELCKRILLKIHPDKCAFRLHHTRRALNALSKIATALFNLV